MSDFRFYHPIEVRYGDLDPQGHVNNAKHLTYFGQNIKVRVHAQRRGNKSMTWNQNIMDADSGRELAKGEVIMVTYDYRAEKTISIPQEWRDKIIQFEGLKVEE